MPSSARHLYEFAGFRLDPAERLLLRGAEPVPLAPKAFDMLVLLVSQSGRLLTKEELLRAIWAETLVEENSLDKTISALRKALGEPRTERKLIETVRGHGYRFNAQVTQIVLAHHDGPVVPPAGPAPLPRTSLAAVTGVVQSALLPPLPATSNAKITARGWSSWFTRFLLGAFLLGGAVALRWPLRGRPPEPAREITVARLTNGGNIQNAVLSPDGRSFAYVEQGETVMRIRLQPVAAGQPITLTHEPGMVISGLTFAPDGQSLYFVSVNPGAPHGTLYHWPVVGHGAAKLLTRIVSPVTFAPDGQHFAFIRWENGPENTSLVLTDRTGGTERVLLSRNGLERVGPAGPSWSPDGQEIACQLWHGLTRSSDEVWRLAAVNVQSGALRLLTPQLWDGLGRLAWLHDGHDLLVVGTKQGESDTTARDAIWLVSQPEGTLRRVTNELSRHFYTSLSVTADGQALMVLPFNRTSQIWSVEAQGRPLQYEARSARQLTTGTSEGRAGMVSLADGHIVYVARTGEHVDLWQMRADGSQPQQLTTEPPFLEELSAPPDGRQLVFAAKRAGFSHLFRVQRDGRNLQQLTMGASREIDSDCSPDGRWVVYASRAPGQLDVSQLWKIPAAGGTPVRLTNGEALAPHYSPDGRWISYTYYATPGQLRLAVIPAEGDVPSQTPHETFAVSTQAELNIGCRWTPDSQALVYIVMSKNAGNLWAQPLAGGAPYPLTNFTSGEIYNFAFAYTGHRLFLARGYPIHDALLIRNFR